MVCVTSFKRLIGEKYLYAHNSSNLFFLGHNYNSKLIRQTQTEKDRRKGIFFIIIEIIK